MWVLKEPAKDAYACYRAREPSRSSLSSLSHVHMLNDALNRFGNAPSCSPGEQDSRELQAPPGGAAPARPQPSPRTAEQTSHQHRKGKSSDQIVYGIFMESGAKDSSANPEETVAMALECISHGIHSVRLQMDQSLCLHFF